MRLSSKLRLPVLTRRSIDDDRKIIIYYVQPIYAWLRLKSDKKFVGIIFISIILLTICGQFITKANAAQKIMYILLERVDSSNFSFSLNVSSEKTRNNHYQTWAGCKLAPFIDRLIIYNHVIDFNREKMLKKIANISLESWPRATVRTLYKNWSYHLVMNNTNDSFSIVSTIYLVNLDSPLSKELTSSYPLDHNNIHVKKYYRWEALHPVCAWLQRWLSHGYVYIDPISRYSWLSQLTNQTCIDSASSHFYQQVCNAITYVT